MRAVIQRVKEASVTIDEKVTGTIGVGILILLGIEKADTEQDIHWLTGKITRLRIFADKKGVMNRSILEVSGDVLIVSQFTLHASIKKGNRPFYGRSADPPAAIPLYEAFIKAIEQGMGKKPATGRFGADMKVHLVNDGPVTILMDSKNIE